jgi:hypothetical protein
MTQPDSNVSRCVSCGVWTENHLVCGVCEVPLHPSLCPWTLRGFPACHCTEAEAQLAAYGYFRGRQDAHARS